MKQLLSILFILLIQAFSVSAQPVQQHEVNWKSINTSMHQYLKYPSSKNARHITSVLPDSPISQTNKSTIATKTTAYVYHILNMVGRQVISGDSAAVHLAFKLRNISDGAFPNHWILC